MHPSTLSRRKFLTLAGAVAAAPFFTRMRARACPVLDDPDEASGLKALAHGINRFGGELNYQLTQDEPGGLFFSPLSVEAALAMTSAGARGQTLAEMEKVLHLPPKNPHELFGGLLRHLNGPDYIKPDPAQQSRPISPVPRPYELTVANAIWAQKGYPWHKEFVELTRKHYGAGLVEVDFAESEAARRRINDWVEKETKNKIKELIGPRVISALTRMVLTNAVYFKGNWQYKFDKANTRDEPFTRADGSKVDVPLMHRTGEYAHGKSWVGGRSGDDVQVLELPYAGREVSMLVLLPSRPDFAAKLADYLTDGDFVRTELKPQRVRVALPRFKAESEFLLNEPLKALGMASAFGAADFSGMSREGKGLTISHVLHKAFVDVNEEGTEAAAATAVVVKAPAPPPREVVFRADRPFVYAIRDNKTGAALFVGRYAGPK
jgi:serpin B